MVRTLTVLTAVIEALIPCLSWSPLGERPLPLGDEAEEGRGQRACTSGNGMQVTDLERLHRGGLGHGDRRGGGPDGAGAGWSHHAVDRSAQ